MHAHANARRARGPRRARTALMMDRRYKTEIVILIVVIVVLRVRPGIASNRQRQ
jgi:hypothetical protein